MLTVGSLFAGIGGFDVGLERAGMQTVWFCEQDPFCQRVLARHWPGVPCHPDVQRLRFIDEYDGSDYEWVGPVDVLCGGFPCQDISLAGRGAGLAGERSGLWREFARLIGKLRPRYVIAENVPALTVRGLDRVLADLAACGFDAEWDHLPASAFGAPHRRDRIWLVAYPQSGGGGAPRSNGDGPRQTDRVGRAGDAMGDPDAERRNGRAGQLGPGWRGEPADSGRWEPQSGVGGMVDELSGGLDSGWWDREPDIPRVATGVPERVDRLRALGNALVPQIAEWIGRQIIAWEEHHGQA